MWCKSPLTPIRRTCPRIPYTFFRGSRKWRWRRMPRRQRSAGAGLGTQATIKRRKPKGVGKTGPAHGRRTIRLFQGSERKAGNSCRWACESINEKIGPAGRAKGIALWAVAGAARRLRYRVGFERQRDSRGEPVGFVGVRRAPVSKSEAGAAVVCWPAGNQRMACGNQPTIHAHDLAPIHVPAVRLLLLDTAGGPRHAPAF